MHNFSKVEKTSGITGGRKKRPKRRKCKEGEEKKVLIIGAYKARQHQQPWDITNLYSLDMFALIIIPPISHEKETKITQGEHLNNHHIRSQA